MKRKLVRELIVPARHGAAFEIKKGQILRVIEVEGPQVGDFNAFNLHNFRERMQAPLSAAFNSSTRHFTKIYTNDPRGRLMFTVVDDPTGLHYLSGGYCTRLHYEILLGIKDHPNCYDILAEAIKPYGLTHYDVHGVLDFFMNVSFDDNGKMIVGPPIAKKGDYMELRAEMDVLGAMSACPDDILGPTNGEDMRPKPLKIEIYEEE